ncbi:hypothetical protein TTHERM_00283360 (macronuclear) [Tetrahymena thermophila SB210]|uniref:Uncharacterized protein n=1 Tax=Tetrahymena thermophila (strain SB210) TaxID=312017 RepID=I7LVE0_TETTS|nr:hypothetical protein TTHERM_00283360 [Tetrahymena thermophila SB210]EAR97947.1 hypothetical protein TTHERM_00283360 [Tetrahymena thermophila SB210]|eukprot:XP_001018192.1 hypothetical protein TTHERM_00283360 [Tetrahymena thermophila SB210]
MFAGTDCSDYTSQLDHLSYHSDQGPLNNSSVQSANATIKTKNILSCMQLIQQQLKEEDIEHINQMENDNTINFFNQYDTFNNNQKQKYLNAVSLQNNCDESNIISTGQFNKNVESNNQSLTQDKIDTVRQIKNYLKSNLDFNEADSNDENSSTDLQNQQNNQSGNSDQLVDEEDIMRRIHQMVEHYKSMSQMEKEGDEEEQEGEIEDDNNQSIKEQNSIAAEEVFQSFLERNQYYTMQKQVNLQKKRMIKQQEENSLQKKNIMSKKSKQICKDISDQFKISIGNRSQTILEKKEYDKILHQATVRYLETQDCSFKPLLNPNSMKILKQNQQRTYDQFYEDMCSWQRQTEQNKAQILINMNLEKERKEQEEKKKLQVGPQIDPNSIKIFEKKNQNGDFLTRLEVDIDKRQLKKKQLELNNQPSFQPLIYENIRSPAIINQMRSEQTNYRMQKVKDEQNTWNQFTSPVSIKSKKANTSFTVSDNKYGINNQYYYDSNVNFTENAAATPLKEKNNKTFTQVVTSSNKQQNKFNANLNSSQNISAKKVSTSNFNANIQVSNDFSNLSESKKNQYNSSNKYNSNSTKFTSIRSNQKETPQNNNKKHSIQLSSNQDFSYSPFESNPYINEDSMTMSQKNQMDQQLQNDKIEKEQFDSFIKQNLNKLKSTLNKQNL